MGRAGVERGDKARRKMEGEKKEKGKIGPKEGGGDRVKRGRKGREERKKRKEEERRKMRGGGERGEKERKGENNA